MFDPMKLRRGIARDAALAHVRATLEGYGLAADASRPAGKPWGVEIWIDPGAMDPFLASCFGACLLPAEIAARAEGPNLMLIEEDHRLSWHYHLRKDALVRVLCGSVSATLSVTDEEPPPRVICPGDLVRILPRTRHRLASLSGWSVIAEIARNADAEDTVRIRDDYGRTGVKRTFRFSLPDPKPRS